MNDDAVAILTDHRILLVVQRQVAGLVAEKAAQQTQIDALVLERDALIEQRDGLQVALTAARETLDKWRRAYYGDHPQELPV
jgi:hypothetical protein